MTIEELNKVNQQLLFVLGASLPLIMRAKATTPQEEKMRNWILEAIECVVYKNEILPPIP